MGKKVVQISIESLSLIKRGPLDGAEDVNVFRFAMAYPAEDIPSIETVKTIKANENIPTNWSSDFDKSIVFKTPVNGKTKLTIEAASIDKDSQAEKTVKSFFKLTFGAVLGVWTGGFGSAYVGAITKSVGTSLIDLVEKDDDIDIIGKASFMLDSEALPDEIELDLEVEKAVVKKEEVITPNGPPFRRQRSVNDLPAIPRGINGHVKLRLMSL